MNPTPEATVQTSYNAHESHDLAIQMKKKGNTVSALKSATPRFQALCETKGPGAYSPEKVGLICFISKNLAGLITQC